MRRVGASLSGLERAASFSVRPMSRVGLPLTSSVGAPEANDLSACSATFPSSGLVSYLVRFGSILGVYESPAASVSRITVNYDFILNRFPASGTLRNTKYADTWLVSAESNNKVNR